MNGGTDNALGDCQGRVPRTIFVPGRWAAIFSVCFAFVCLLMVFGGTARALEAVPVIGSEERVELTNRGVAVSGRGDKLQIDTAPGADNISRRMSVNATTPGTNPTWMVFALTNNTDKLIERWIAVQRYSLSGSGIIWPDLDSRRMTQLTPSVGFLPQRIENDRADIFRITIDPGQTITYAAEMASTRVSRVEMWEPLAYEFHVRERRLFNGIMLGITGLLGIFLTAVFAANHKAIFPSAALVTWCVLVYLCVDFGFWHKLLQISAEENAVYRAATEAAMAASLAIFLHTFLRLGNWNGFVRMLASVWIVAQIALVCVSILDPRLASTFARLSFAALGVVGALLILFLAFRGQDRALSLIPTWLLFLVWLFGTMMTLTGKLHGDVVVSGLVAGLVLITVLIGFTVTQFAFRSVQSHYGAAPSEQQLRSLAVEGAGAAVWEWHARRDEIKIGPVAEMALGLNVGELCTKAKDFVRHMHPADQERFNVLLWSVQNKNGGEIRTDFRMRHADNSYRWFDLEAASIPTSDRRSLRCVGLLRDVTDQKRSQARLMEDAVQDSLTGLPNRELFLDRLRTSVARVDAEPKLRPTVFFIDLDKFKSVNDSFGILVGDSLLLTISRRLTRHLAPMDTLARFGGDQFAMLVLSVTEPEGLARLAEAIRRSLRAPIKIAGQEIVLTGAIGIAVHDPVNPDALDILKDSEIAMYRAKRNGADQIEIFRPEMRNERDDRVAIESDLHRAVERRQIKVVYQPIIYLPTEELAGFEALVRWEHPRLGLLNPQDFVPVAEESDLIVKLGSFVLTEAVEQAAKWQKQLPRSRHPLFVSVNVSSRQLFNKELIEEIRHIIGRAVVPADVLRLEITESLVMENPERAADMLDLLKIAGAGLALDDFGTGYSSLAYLERFPFDTIKIDRHLIQSTSSGDGTGSVIVRSIVAMAKELNRQVVAEGVEASDDVSFLRSIGCQYAQGFYYGEPMAERDVGDLLKIVAKSERKLQRRGFFGAAAPSDERDKADKPKSRGDIKAQAKGAGKDKTSEVVDGAASAPDVGMPTRLPNVPDQAPPPANPQMPPGMSPVTGRPGGDHHVQPSAMRQAPPQPTNGGPKPPPPPGFAGNQGGPAQAPSLSHTGSQGRSDLGSAPNPSANQHTPGERGRRMPPPHWSEAPRPGAAPHMPASQGDRLPPIPEPGPTARHAQPLGGRQGDRSNRDGQAMRPDGGGPMKAPPQLRADETTQPPATRGHNDEALQRRDGGPPPMPGEAPQSNVVHLPPDGARDFSTLPPSIAQSLARLAGSPTPTANDSPERDRDGRPVDGDRRKRPAPKLEAGE